MCRGTLPENAGRPDSDAERVESKGPVVVRIRAHGTGRASGIQIEGEVAHLWEVRDTKIVSSELTLTAPTRSRRSDQGPSVDAL